MKKITIGRGRECDVRIDDPTDTVSRRQAVITVSPTGKMVIYDTSSNGTFVNGEPVRKPDGTPVRRGDTVNLAHIVDLDWEKVKDPYRSRKLMVGIFFIVVAATVAGFFFMADLLNRKEVKDPENPPADTLVSEQDSEPRDSLTLKIPEETSPAAPKAKKQAPREEKRKERKTERKPTEKVIKEVEELPSVKKMRNEQPQKENNGTLDDAIKDQR